MEIRSREAIKAELIAMEIEALMEAMEIRRKIDFLKSQAGPPPLPSLEDCIRDMHKSQTLAINKIKKDISEKNFIKIDIPEGKELDQEAFKEGRIEWKDNKVTYRGIVEKLWNEAEGKGIGTYFHLSEKYQLKFEAIHKLMNVAKYLNGDWRNSIGALTYCFALIDDDEIAIKSICSDCIYGDIVFKSQDLAERALSILGEEVIRQALSTDY